MSAKRLSDELEAARGELAHAEQSVIDGHKEYRAYVAQGDLQMAANAKRGLEQSEKQRAMLADRVDALESAVAEAEQAAADAKLKQATKRAEEAAEKERQAAAEVDAIREQMAVTLDRLKATSDESFRASAAMIQAADAAGTDAPRVRRAMTNEADPNRLTALARHIAGLFNQQSQGAVEQTSRRRKTG